MGRHQRSISLEKLHGEVQGNSLVEIDCGDELDSFISESWWCGTIRELELFDRGRKSESPSFDESRVVGENLLIT